MWNIFLRSFSLSTWPQHSLKFLLLLNPMCLLNYVLNCEQNLFRFFIFRSGLARVSNIQLRLLRLCRLMSPSNRSIKLYQTTRRNIPEDRSLHSHFCENHNIISTNFMFLDIIHRPVYIVPYSSLVWLIIMDSGLDDSIYWHFVTITINDNSSQSMAS
jgi:hypothetical protein